MFAKKTVYTLTSHDQAQATIVVPHMTAEDARS